MANSLLLPTDKMDVDFATMKDDGDAAMRQPQDDDDKEDEVRVLLSYGNDHVIHKGVRYYLMTTTTTSPPVPVPASTQEQGNSNGNGNSSSYLQPPPGPLRNRIDAKTWQRFRGHMAGVRLLHAVGGDDHHHHHHHNRAYNISTNFVFGLWAAFTGGLISSSKLRDNGMFTYVYIGLGLALFMSTIYGKCSKHGDHYILTQGYTRVLDKMQPTFQTRFGYRVSLDSFMDWCGLRRRYYVVFTRDPSLTVEGPPTPMELLEETYGPYHAPDWMPLLGTWNKVHEHVPQHHFFGFFRSLVSESSLVWTWEGTTTAPETLVWNRIAKGRGLWGLFPRNMHTTSRVKQQPQQPLVSSPKDDDNDDDSVPLQYVNAMEYVPDKPDSRVHQVMRDNTRLRPLPTRATDNDDGQQAQQLPFYYLQGDTSVWVVAAFTLTKYDFSFFEDMPSTDDILQGVLLERRHADWENDNTCMVWHFQRATKDTADTSSLVYMDKKEENHDMV